jgi:hypothetical protein
VREALTDGVFSTDYFGCPVLFYAVKSTNSVVLPWLLAEGGAGASILQTETCGITVITHAIRKSHFRGAQLLIEHEEECMIAVTRRCTRTGVEVSGISLSLD